MSRSPSPIDQLDHERVVDHGHSAPPICDPPRPEVRKSRRLLSREDRAGVLALRRREGLSFRELSAVTQVGEAVLQV